MGDRNRKIKEPVTRGAAKVPVIMQLEALECGAAALAMVMAYYDKWVPLEQVRVDCGVSRDGSNAWNVMQAAMHYGFTAEGFRYGTESIKRKGYFPCIIHWNFNHFVVLDGFKGDNAVINDPACGRIVVSAEEFDRSFTGICLLFKPSESFEPSGKRQSTLSFARKRLRGAGTAVAFVMLTSMIGYLFNIVNPVMTKVFVDRLLTHRSDSWLLPFTILMAVLAGLQLTVAWAHAIYSLKINGKMSIIGSTTFMWKLMRMPVEFFDQRVSGDIMERHRTNAGIAETMVNTLAPLALNSLMAVFYLVVMINHSLLLTSVGLAALALDLIVSRIISEKRINITLVQERDKGKLSSATISGIEMVETIKASGAENGFFRKWSGYQASVNEQQVKFDRMDQYLGMIPEFLSTLANYSVMVIGVFLAMNGRFTVGMITAFQGFLDSFMEPAQTFVTAGQTLIEMRTQMERVEDVMEYPADPYVTDLPLDDDTDYSKLIGGVELKNVTFGYSRLAEPLIQHLDLSIPAGKRVAIVGSSGCGKSTVSKLVSGLYQPWEGEILFDGKPIPEIDRAVFTGSVAVVDQEVILFEDTIAANIRMWDDTIEDFEVILAARDAQLHQDIMRRDGGYNYRLSEGGRDLSGGERQRLEIARVLAQDPSVVILDEATSALDAETESRVVNAIRQRGITCIVIAHRLSTVRDCDEIVVMKKGSIIDRGTHEELCERCGYYAELISNE